MTSPIPVPKGSSGAVAILLATLFLAASFYGYTSITAHLTPATPGCSAPSLPLSIGTGSGGIDPPPEANTQRSSSYKYELTWELGDVYPEWGGVMSVSLTNTGGNTIYINSLGIRGDWIDSGINLEKGIYVEPGEKEGLGIIPFPGPHYSNPNRYYHYQLALGFLVLDDILMEEGEERWYDPGSVLHGDRSFTLKPLGDERPVFYTSTRNSLWERVENLVAPEDPGVKAIVSDLRSQYGEGYNVDHAVAAFHYVRRNIDYEIELPGEDKWQSPGETLRVGRGDCEDHSLLLASIITGLGGGVRINVISGHAFPTIYLGSTTEEANTLWRAVERFYDLDSSLPSEARPSPCWIVDDGYWLCADTLGGLYLGGLPVNAAPTYPPSYSSSSSAASSSASLQTWEWSFTSTMVVSMIPA